jgi:hypothetical protein
VFGPSHRAARIDLAMRRLNARAAIPLSPFAATIQVVARDVCVGFFLFSPDGHCAFRPSSTRRCLGLTDLQPGRACLDNVRSRICRSQQRVASWQPYLAHNIERVTVGFRQ